MVRSIMASGIRAQRPVLMSGMVMLAALSACGKPQQNRVVASTSVAAPQAVPTLQPTAAPTSAANVMDCSCPKIIADPNGIYQGAFVADAITEAGISSFEKISGEKVDIGLVFRAFATGLDFPANQAQVMADRGGTIFIKLEPWSWKGANDQSFSLENIIAGKHDNLLNRFAEGAKAFGRPIFVSFGHEMNGNWYPWAGKPELYKQAYQHVHDVITKTACNTTWVWNPNVDLGNITAYYPGDKYVDWVAADGYSTTVWGNSCRSMEQLFSGIMSELQSFNKPLMVGETASDLTTCPQSTFLNEAVGYLARSNVKAFVYFNIDKNEGGKNMQWAIDTAPSQSAYSNALSTRRALFAQLIQAGCSPSAAPAKPAQPQPQVSSPAPADALTIDSIQQGSFSFNGGTVALENGVYTFSAKQAKDPGFGIPTGNSDLAGRKTLKFEIMGSLKQLGGYARFIAQVYDDGDNDATPAVMLDPVELTGSFQTITVNLQGRVDKAKKVQFLLVTDKGDCNVQVRNLRFE